MEETCNNCDNTYSMIWNNQTYCKYGTHGDNTCHKPKMYQKFILRRDKRSCGNCKYGEKKNIYCELKEQNGSCGGKYIYDNWKPITEKEPTKPEYTGCLNCEDFIVPLGSKPCKGCAENNHENFRPKQEKEPTEFTGCDQCQFKPVPGNRLPCKGCKTNNYVNFRPMKKETEMEYKPTSKCTLKNIASKINETGCSEAKAELFDACYELSAQGFGNNAVNYLNDEVHKDSPLYKVLTKTEKRRNWLSEHGFIEPIHDTSVYEDSVFYDRHTNKKQDWSLVFHKGTYALVDDNLRTVGTGHRVKFFPIDIKELLNAPHKYHTKRG